MEPSEPTNLELAILGLLDFQPMSGYDVQRAFATTPLAHFSSSPGAIYPTLKRLEKRGLVEATLDRTREARPRRVYAMAEAGRQALVAWLRQPVTREELVRNGAACILRFSLSGKYLTPGEVVAYLESYRGAARAYLSELDEHRRALAPQDALHHQLSLLHGIRGYEATVAWVDEAIHAVTAAAPAVRT